ncbi:glycosyl hydrolase family 32 [Sphingobacterium sp. SGG-5]|uniref:exo-alpha-sialidase n=1 Tax=Sphingobacterium sp. SGG-5 TaxID=2710881 RepID=UPI0013EC5A1E|nr:exo-alpha-sialidase [Sphingobacterium sp. SGG-5]NGM62377.1 glycosyl hydrolase family 32 [Sphingobacterium sp. SGG-5]
MIFQPGEDWHYVHHPSIAYFNKNFYAIFSNGRSGEDDPGQRVMIVQSTDGNRWTRPQVLAEPQQGKWGLEKVLTPGGIFVLQDSLCVLYTDNDMDGETYKRHQPKLYMVKSADGLHWTAPYDLKLSVFPCHRPTITMSGRILLTGNRAVYYTDDPSGVTGWKKGADDFDARDMSLSFNKIKPSLCEGAILEYGADSLSVLFRSTGKTYNGFLWQIASGDNGESWSIPQQTNFTDANSKSYLGRLPNGKYYYIGTPDSLTNRVPLVLALSDDGFLFDKTYIIAKDYYPIRHKGKWKNGQFGYPYSIIVDSSLYVVVTREKEKLELIKIDLEQLK